MNFQEPKAKDEAMLPTEEEKAFERKLLQILEGENESNLLYHALGPIATASDSLANSASHLLLCGFISLRKRGNKQERLDQPVYGL